MPLFDGDNIDPRGWNWQAFDVRGLWRRPQLLVLALLVILAAGAGAYWLWAREAPQPELGEEPVIDVYFHEEGQVRSMPIEEYLEGVVAAEMDPGWPEEALSAQAIIARTFTLRKMEEGGVPGRNADASTDHTEFQAYDADRVNDRVRSALKSCRGKIITYDGRPVLAWFHASSGGRTATPEEGLGFTGEETPYLRVIDDMDETEDVTWDRTFSISEVEAAAASLGYSVSPLTELEIGDEGPSGRALTLDMNGTSVPAPELRLALGPEDMRSTLLDEVEITNGEVRMNGRGFGHGVGLSQWGAWIMAQRGKSAEDIVKFYYRGVDIERRW